MSSTLLYHLLPAHQLLPAELPLYASPVSAGLASSCNGQPDPPLNLTRHPFRNPASTFLARMAGDSMTGAGIYPGDLVAVDRALPAREGSIVVAMLDGEHTVKRLRQRQGRTWLEAENDQYAPLEILESTHLDVWGVVTHVIRAPESRPPASSPHGWGHRKSA